MLAPVSAMIWVFGTALLIFSVLACWSRSMRTAILSLWLAGLSVGAIYISLGAETLAVIQWIVSTLVAVVFIFYAALFGELDETGAAQKPGAALRAAWPTLLPAALTGAAFFAVLMMGLSATTSGGKIQSEMSGSAISNLGNELTSKNFIALEILAVTLLLTVVGVGAVSRVIQRDQSGGES